MDSSTQIPYNYLDKYLTTVRAKGRYSFTLEELKKEFDIPYRALKQSLYRLKTKNEIVQIRQGFYIIILPEYSKQGMLPPYLFIDDLMKFLDKKYYIGLLSAAALHGAAHQQPMEYFVIAETLAPKNIENEKLKISFISKKEWEKEDIIQKNSDAGFINVSTPELTALDLLAYVDRFGLNRATTVLQELVESMKPSVLSRIAKKYPAAPVIQRLGYILDRILNEEKLSDALYKVLNDRNISPVLLSTKKSKVGVKDEKWDVIKNMEIESDL